MHEHELMFAPAFFIISLVVNGLGFLAIGLFISMSLYKFFECCQPPARGRWVYRPPPNVLGAFKLPALRKQWMATRACWHACSSGEWLDWSVCLYAAVQALPFYLRS